MTWLRIDADMPWHDKIVGLPNDTARFGFVKALCAAKVRGRAAFSESSLKEAMGSHAKAIPQLIEAGLLEQRDGKIEVHDFDDYQRKALGAERQQRYRERHASVTDSVTPALPTGQDIQDIRDIRDKQARAREDNLPEADDSVTIACRMFMDGGRWLGDREYVAAWEDMDHRYSPAWVQEEIAPAYAAIYAKAGKIRPWDLKRMVELRCAERARAGERDRERHRQDADMAETEVLRRKAETATDEERERASVVRRAVGLWIKKRPRDPVPTDFDSLASWLAENGAA